MIIDKGEAQSFQLTLMVRNQPGVLVRCAQVLSRRGHNIDSLKVSVIPENPELSKMIITSSGSRSTIQQIATQLMKLVDVINIS